MNILLISSELPPGPGGIGSHCHQVALALARHGWQVTVLAPQDYADDDEIQRWNAQQPIEVRRLRHLPGPPLEGLSWGFAALKAIRQKRPDLLLATGQRAVWLTARLASLCRLPWVAVGHGVEFGSKRGWQKALNRSSYPHANAVISVSQYTRQTMLEAGLKPTHSPVIPNGADGEQFHNFDDERVATFRQRQSVAAPGRRLLLTVGNVGQRKGQDLVIRALPRILQNVPGAHYVLIGLPTAGDELKALAEQLGVSEHVHILGKQPADEVLAHLNACDLFVMTSRHTAEGDFEGFGIAVVEAALCGKPAVVAKDSGLVEAIVPDQTGLAVPVEDPDAIADAVLRLLQDDDLRRTMGQAALDRARREQTWKHRGQEYHELLTGIVAEHQS